MPRKPFTVIGYTLIAILLVACAPPPPLMAVPDTQPGEQILDEYMLGKWCTNREETAVSNQAAGFSGLLNVSPEFWRFEAEGLWENSESGFMYQPIGKWQIVERSKLELSRDGVEPKTYQANFKNSGEGLNLYLTDDEGHFTVLERCK